jgi:hypothetical protein
LLACSLLAGCAKPFLASFHRQEEFRVTHCDEIERAHLGRFLDSNKWLDTDAFLSRKASDQRDLQMRHSFRDSVLEVNLRLSLEPEDFWEAGLAFESIAQDIEAHAFGCDLRYYSESISSWDTAKSALPPQPSWDSLDAGAMLEAWHREIGSPMPSSYISRHFRNTRGGRFYPEVQDFENRYRQSADIALALFFQTRPVVHPVFHTLIFTEREGRFHAVYSHFKDGYFLWKAAYVLDSARFNALRSEVDFIAKANTYILGRTDYVDLVVQNNCMQGGGMAKAGTDAEVRRIEDKCRSHTHGGVFLDRRHASPIYLYEIQDLANGLDRRILEDLRMKSIRNILRELPAGDITWKL